MKLSPRFRVTLLFVSAVVVALIIAVLRMSYLPLRQPADFAVEWRSGGGQLPERSEALIKVGQSYWDFYLEQGEEPEHFTFITTQQEMDELYLLLRNRAADRLKMEQEIIYDGDNSGFSLSWADRYVNIWGMQIISIQKSRYQEVYQELQDFLVSKVPQHPAIP